jgi:alpha-methylacyl-CoA racemase
MAYPLRGIKVLEMEGLAPTVLAGQILADLGADVTIISRPEPPSISAEMSTNILNRGKKSIVFDLKKADDLKCC